MAKEHFVEGERHVCREGRGVSSGEGKRVGEQNKASTTTNAGWATY